MSVSSDEEDRIFIEITPSPLKMDTFVEWVKDKRAGAISTFSGVTRDNFNNREVLELQYEAYVPMAIEELRKICNAVFEKWVVIKIAVGHRIGTVNVGETSVILSISSPHRKDALEAIQWMIDKLKEKVPIWKKEVFADGYIWKENMEARQITDHQ